MDPILYWNAVALEAVAADFTGAQAPEQKGPTLTARALAMVHIAMHDAYFGAGGPNPRGYALYTQGLGPLGSGGDPATAVGAAAVSVLGALYPRQKDLVARRHLADPLANAAAGASYDYGAMVAQAVLALRAGDRADAAHQGAGEAAYAYATQYGKHRPDPVTARLGDPPLHPRWGDVTLFGVPALLPLDPPPGYNTANYLGDATYRQHHDEVRAKGGHPALRTTTRTPAETAIGLYWAYDGAQGLGTPPRLYNQVLRVLANQQGNTPEENARLFMLANVAMADAGIHAWHWKYVYNLWRPVVGIREADLNVGPAAPAGLAIISRCDPFWQPLGAPDTNRDRGRDFTPGFPAYPSGHATFGAAAFQSARLFFRERRNLPFADRQQDNLSFDFVSDELDGVSRGADGVRRPRHNRRYPSLWRAIIENGESRVYLGVHWRFDAFLDEAALADTNQHVGGIPLGLDIAEAVLASYPA